MSNPECKFLTPHDVGRILGVTATRVRQLDDQLRPMKTAGRGARFYEAEAVERFMKERDAARAPKQREAKR